MFGDNCDGLLLSSMNALEKTLLEGLTAEWLDMRHSDAVLVCGENRLKTHKLVLASLSDMMYDALKGVPETEKAVIYVEGADEASFAALMKAVYGGDDIDYQKSKNAVDLLGVRTPQEEEEEEEEDPADYLARLPSPLPPLPKLVKKRSLVWNYFIPSRRGWNNCKACGREVSAKNSNTSTMMKHLHLYHTELYREFNAMRKSTDPLTAPLEEDKEEDEQPQRPAPRKPRLNCSPGKWSPVWNFFSPLDENGWRNSCLTCGREVSGKGNTSNMIRHLRKNHGDLCDSFWNKNSRTKRIVPKVEFAEELPLEEDNAEGDEEEDEEAVVEEAMEEVMEEEKNDAIKKEDFESIQNMITKTDEIKLLNDRLKEDDLRNTRTCPDCRRDFSGNAAMQHHWRAVHSGIKPFACELCSATFSRVDTFKAHIGSVHSQERPFLCSVCGKTFARRNVRDMHERVHKEDRRYKCDYCDKLFFTNQQKKNHERTHTGEKPYQCSDCGRGFTMMHQLTTHKRIHTGDRPYRCDNCYETFKYISSRNRHLCDRSKRNETESKPQEPTMDASQYLSP